MSKPFTYWVRLATVATLCTLTTFNPVLAGRCIERLLKRNHCVPACIDVPAQECCIVVTPCVPAPSQTASDELPQTTHVAPESAAPAESAPPTATEAKPEDPAVEPSVPSTPIEPTAPAAEPPAAVTPAVPLVPLPGAGDSAPKGTDPVDALFDDEPVKAAEPAVIADPTPAVVTPTEAEGEAPVKEAPVKEDPIGDLFGDAANTDAPGIKTDPVKDTDIDDLFGTEEATPPAKDDTETPPKQSIDDIFGIESTTPPAGKPATEAKEALDDLFGTGTADSPATPPKAASGNELDDFFGTEASEPPPAKIEPAPAQNESIDELFGKPVSTESADSKNDNDKYLDSLFLITPATKTESPAAEPKQKSEPKTEPKKDVDPLDILFGLGEFTPPEEFRGAEFQTWVDNTGTYSVKAQLAVIYTDRVKLLKENGKYTTVPLSRLSDRDFAYVQWVAGNLSAESNTKFVKKEIESTNTENIR